MSQSQTNTEAGEATKVTKWEILRVPKAKASLRSMMQKKRALIVNIKHQTSSTIRGEWSMKSWNARTSHVKAWHATANSSWSNWTPELPRIIRTKALWSSTRSFFNSWWCTRSCLGKWKGGGLPIVSKGTCEDLHQLWLSTYQYRVWWGYKNSKYLIIFLHTVSDIRIYIYHIYVYICVWLNMCMYNCQCCDMAKRMQKATGGDFQNPRLKDTFLVSSLLGYSYNFKGRWLDCIATTAGCCDLKDFSSTKTKQWTCVAPCSNCVTKLVGMMNSSSAHVVL